MWLRCVGLLCRRVHVENSMAAVGIHVIVDHAEVMDRRVTTTTTTTIIIIISIVVAVSVHIWLLWHVECYVLLDWFLIRYAVRRHELLALQ